MMRIGTAGWTIPRQNAHAFPATGSSLERYATRFGAVEINSSFHREHRPATWEHWRDSVPDDFRFSVKVAKEITHRRQLVDCSEPLDKFLAQTSLLKDKLGVLLVQLPPKLAFDEGQAAAFLSELRDGSPADIACEPRHATWFTPAANALLEGLKVARVAADPPVCPDGNRPGGWRELSYWRLHGSPVMYRSSYSDRIPGLANGLRRDAEAGKRVWCMFDNTASSAATSDSLALVEALSS